LIYLFIVFNATFSNISVISSGPVLVVGEAGVPGENHRPWASNWQALSLAAPFLVHLAFRPSELLSSLFVRRPSVNISHFNLLLRNHRTNCNQTLVEWSLDGPLSKLCPEIPTSNQDGHQAENKKKGV
jgi:hypothetical protein